MMTLEEAIESLGDSYVDTIRVLTESGIKGKAHGRDICRDCVIARYLEAKTGAPVAVGYGWAEHANQPSLRLPEHLKEIIKQFDRGALPELLGD